MRLGSVGERVGVFDVGCQCPDGGGLQQLRQSAIARALRLADVERSYLRNLVRSTVTVPASDDVKLEPLAPGTRMMLDRMKTPGLIIDFRGDVVAMNRMDRAMLAGLEPGASHSRWLFL